MIEIVLLALSPVIVRYATDGIKKLKSIDLSKNKVVYIKSIVALLSLGTAVGNVLLNGGEVDGALIQTTIESVLYGALTYFGATGIYHDTTKEA